MYRAFNNVTSADGVRIAYTTIGHGAAIGLPGQRLGRYRGIRHKSDLRGAPGASVELWLPGSPLRW